MSCVAFGCYNNSSKKIAGITFHRFPKEEILRNEWVKAVKRENWNPSKHSVLCSEHFEESDFDRCSTLRVYLKPNVVPSVFKAFPKHLQKVKHTRRPIHRQLSLGNAKACEKKSASTICIATNCIEDSESVPILQEGNSSEVHLEETNASVSEGQPEMACLKRKLEVAEASIQNYKKKIKLLQQTNRRNKKKISDLKSLMKDCKNKGLITDDSLQILYKAAGPNKELITRQLCKVTNSPIAKFYSPELRKFALTLHFYSPRAYNYVRESFNSCLPHPRTIGKWYQHVDVEPGFTSQAMKALKKKVDSSEMPLFFALIFDEMAIRQHVEFDGAKFHGYIDVGIEIDDDALPIAREAMVFMVVCINAHFKIPVGYFLCSGLTSEQKANLVQQCLIQLHDHHVNIVSCTFDGLSSNLSMAKQLGCNFKSIFPPKPICPSKQGTTTSLALDVQDDNIEFQSFEDIEFEWTDEDEENFVQPSSTQQESKKKNRHSKPKSVAPLKLSISHPTTNEDIFIFPDPSHMVKLLRNCLGEKGTIIDADNSLISWKYIQELHKLQETEGLHLANKLKAQHIFFSRQKMKVKLATQLFSKSVADAIEFCTKVLKLPQFQGSDATVSFLRNMNDLFDILNSRNCHQYGYKQALSCKNSVEMLRRLLEIEEYILKLKINKDSDSILNSNRKTGFLGFIICIKSTVQLYKMLVESKKLVYLPLHKLSQDHVELFFQMIRSQGGCNNNPTARQFKSAYRKLLVKTELKNVDTGNCSSKNEISLLTVGSSTLKSSKQVINSSTDGYRTVEEDNSVKQIQFDHDYLYSAYLNECSQHIVFYIAGNVAFYLASKLVCGMCVSALQAATPHYSISLIDYKNLGNLIYPSEDVYKICKKAELNFRTNLQASGGKSLNRTRDMLFICTQTLQDFIGTSIFPSLKDHMRDTDPTENHVIHLTRSIIQRYLKVRLYHFSKTIVSNAKSLRQLYTKTILFKGQ